MQDAYASQKQTVFVTDREPFSATIPCCRCEDPLRSPAASRRQSSPAFLVRHPVLLLGRSFSGGKHLGEVRLGLSCSQPTNCVAEMDCHQDPAVLPGQERQGTLFGLALE